MNHNKYPTSTEQINGDLGGPNGEGMSGSIDMSAFEDSLSQESAVEPSYETQEREITSPTETVDKQANRVAEVITPEAAVDTEDTDEQPDSESPEESDLDKYSTKTAKGIDWVAEKIDNEKDGSKRFDVATKLYDVAYRMDEEGKKEIAKSVLKNIGKSLLESVKTDLSTVKSLSILSADKLRAGIDKMDKNSRINDGFLKDKIKDVYSTAKESRAKRLQDKAYASYEGNLAYTETNDYDVAKQIDSDFNKRRDQDTAYDSYSHNIDYSADHIEALLDNEAYKKAQEEALVKAYAARLKKARRARKYQKLASTGKEKLSNGKERVSNSRLGRIGRASVQAVRNLKTYHEAGKAGLKSDKDIRNEKQSDYDLSA